MDAPGVTVPLVPSGTMKAVAGGILKPKPKEEVFGSAAVDGSDNCGGEGRAVGELVNSGDIEAIADFRDASCKEVRYR